MLLLFSSDYESQKQCISTSRKSNFMLDYRVRRCQIREIFLYKKVLGNDILIRILDYAGVGLEKFDCKCIYIDRTVNVCTLTTS